MSTQDPSKLPKWAQDRIRVAEMRAAEADKRVTEVFGAWPNNRTVVRLHLSGRDATEIHLPEHSSVVFTLNDRPDDWIEVRLKEGRVHVQAHDSLNIHPEGGTNTVSLGLVQRKVPA